jgi:hypothetical protein
MKSESNSPFCLNNSHLLRLSQISSPFYIHIKIENQIFSFNKEQIFFLSVPVYYKILRTERSFIISMEKYTSKTPLTLSHLIACFAKIHSLFFKETQVEFVQADQPYLQFLATILDNQSLDQFSKNFLFLLTHLVLEIFPNKIEIKSMIFLSL